MCLVSLQFSKLQWMTLWSCLTEPMRTLDCSARWLGHILVSLHDACPKLHISLLNTSYIQCLHSVLNCEWTDKLSVKQWTLPSLNECHGRKNYLCMDANVCLEMADCFPLLMDDYLSNINNIWVWHICFYQRQELHLQITKNLFLLLIEKINYQIQQITGILSSERLKWQFPNNVFCF